MEKLVNYSSEEEQDDQNYKSAAERGSYLKRTTPRDGDDSRRRRIDKGGGNSPAPYSSSTGRSSAGVGRPYKEENSQKYKSPHTASTYNNNRTSSQYQHNRGNRDNRDTRDSRDNRDSRDFSNGNRNDNKNDRFNRSKEYNRDHRRDNHDTTRRPRDEGRPQRGGGANNDYNNRNSSSSSHHKQRFNNNRSNDSSMQRQRHQRSRDDRTDNRTDHRSDRGERKQRIQNSRSRSHSSSPMPSSSAAHSKRYSSRNEERARNRVSNSRSRSRSHSPATRSQKRSASPAKRERIPKPLDQVRSTALDLERKLNATSEPKTVHETTRLFPRNTEAVLSLPLSDNTPKPPTVIAVASTGGNSAGEPSVIQLPSYYNPSVINPNKYAEQVQKRKLIWGAKKAEDTSGKWGHAQFSQDSDGKVASKFMRLMGIKGGVGKSDDDAAEVVDKKPAVETDVKSREKMFTSMEQQYEVARQVTHTMRGVGLGFSSQTRPF